MTATIDPTSPDLTPTLYQTPAGANPETLPVTEPELVALADRLLRDLKDCRDERAVNGKARTVEVDRICAAYEDLDVPLERREASLLSMLEQVAKALPLYGKRSRNLAFGEVGWTHQNQRLEVVDPKATEDWIKGLDFPDRTKLLRKVETLKIDKKALDAYCLDDPSGPMIPAGCELIPERDKFHAKPTEPKV